MANDIEILVKASDTASQTIRGAGGSLTELASAVGLAQKAFGAVQQVFAVTVDAAAEAQKVMAQTEAVIKSTGGAAGFSAAQIADMAGEFRNLTAFTDDAIQSMQNVLLTFTGIKGAEFEGATQAILDMSAALGTDLEAAAIQVGKALNDPIQGISALQRVGVSFSASQKEVIRSLVETGQVAEAQRLILAELNVEFGGSAAAQLDTYSGQVDRLKDNFGELGEAIGSQVIPPLADFVGHLNQAFSNRDALVSAFEAGTISTDEFRLAITSVAFAEDLLAGIAASADNAARATDGWAAGMVGAVTQAQAIAQATPIMFQAVPPLTALRTEAEGLAAALDAANLAAQGWAQQAGSDIEQALSNAGVAGETMGTALGVVDEKLNTSLQPAFEYRTEVQQLADEFAKSGDIDAFGEAIAGLEEDFNTAQEQADEITLSLKAVRTELALLTNNPWRINLTLNAPTIPGSITPSGPGVRSQSGGLIPAGYRIVGERGEEGISAPPGGAMITNNFSLGPISNNMDLATIARQVAREIYDRG